MLTYALRRLLISIPLLLVVSVVTYVLLFKASDPYVRLRQVPGVSAAEFERLVNKLSLDQPWYEGYWSWLKGFVQGDWGISTTNRAVEAFDRVIGVLPATLELMVCALIVSTLFGAALGIYSAIRPYSGFDFATTGFAYLGFAMPTFLLGLLLQLWAIWMKDHGWAIIPFVLGLVIVLMTVFRLRGSGPSTKVLCGIGAAIVALSIALWNHLGGDGSFVFYTSQRFSFDHEGDLFSLNHFQHLFLPVLTLSVIQIASWSRYQRAAMLEVMSADYLRTARAKGLSERALIYRHALRNAVLPLITVMAIDLGALFAGAVITETVFSWPGIGKLLYDSAVNRDIGVAMGIVMIGGVMVVLFNLLADLAYSVADPRIRLG